MRRRPTTILPPRRDDDWPQRSGRTGKKPESHVRGKIVAALKPLRAFAVENLCSEGTPDIALTTGWIEVKRVNAWPVGEATPLRLPLFTPEQRIFLREWRLAGGRSWLFLAIGPVGDLHAEGMILDGQWAADNAGYVSREVLIVNAIRHWPARIHYPDLVVVCR